ncbi:MAG: primosomal protein N' [Alphaproteobacteria bacterium]|nr:primosomal protein N' [Alphaproteobacteria bacterium]
MTASLDTPELDLSPDAPARVAVLLPRPLKGAYDYLVPAGVQLERGDLVIVPLGASQTIGCVLGPASGEAPAAKLRVVEHVFPGARLPENLLRFIDWMADYTVTPPGEVLSLVLRVPAALEPEPPVVALTRGPETPERLSPQRERVLAVADDGFARLPRHLAEEAGVTSAVVRGLEAAGALSPVELPAAPAPRAPDPDHEGVLLTKAQREAADALVARVAGGFSVSLLDGVTGAGKTETYFEMVAAALRGEGQILILLPEIALTVQFLDRFERRFGVRPQEWHSDLKPRERRRVYRWVMEGSARVIVGARSALILPYANLSLIIVDEEHEQAFKQDEGVIYHARDMAVVRAMLAEVPIVLSSATPSLETWVNATSGRYHHVRLPARHGDAGMPAVELVDLRAAPPARQEWLSPLLHLAIGETLKQREQVLLFLNRRGYAPLTLCRACGHRLGCPHCSAWLVEHRYLARLKCHHCGYDVPIPKTCPQCGAKETLAASGPGVERVAEEARAHYPGALIAVASSDMLRGPRQVQAAIEAMADGGTDILIGTQMVAKGHHFPLLTLVGVVDADIGLQGGDPRARERTFQLLHQVAGRAGRAERRGRVLIQTTRPEDPLMKALATGDRDGFLALEAEDRRVNGFPPFGRLAAILLSGREEALVMETARRLRAAAPLSLGVEVWGPAPAAMARLRGETRVRLLVQAERRVKLSDYIRTWLGLVQVPGKVRLSVDVDPVSFL